MEKDLRPHSAKYMLAKYASDTSLLVSENTDVFLADEYTKIKEYRLLKLYK